MGRRVGTRLALFGAVLMGATGSATLATRGATPRDGERAVSPHYVFPVTGFGGYQWSGQVTEIGSTWRVPQIDADSPSGAAATWIGAQDNATGQFIQVGVFEQCVAPSTITYRAFWSDRAL